jgi:hypothetical protein
MTSQLTNLTPSTIEDMWCEISKTLIGYRLSPCHQAHELNFADSIMSLILADKPQDLRLEWQMERPLKMAIN